MNFPAHYKNARILGAKILPTSQRMAHAKSAYLFVVASLSPGAGTHSFSTLHLFLPFSPGIYINNRAFFRPIWYTSAVLIPSWIPSACWIHDVTLSRDDEYVVVGLACRDASWCFEGVQFLRVPTCMSCVVSGLRFIALIVNDKTNSYKQLAPPCLHSRNMKFPGTEAISPNGARPTTFTSFCTVPSAKCSELLCGFRRPRGVRE